MQSYLRAELIRLASAPSAEDWLAQVQADKQAHGVRLSAEEILALRDAGRR